MGKSHYFVAPHPEEDQGIKYCLNCGKPFPCKKKSKKYCSQECYKEATKRNKAIWFQKNKPRIRNRVKNYKERIKIYEVPKLKEKKVNPFILKARDLIIKKKLIKMELLSFQIFSDNHDRELPPAEYGSGHYYVKEDRVAFIKERLKVFELYFDQILKARENFEPTYYPEISKDRGTVKRPWVHKHTADILEKQLEIYED